tara:strand:+ start:1709 stop:5386 length:3678 start_codon:yes stop_codon:yes gene_type:complete
MAEIRNNFIKSKMNKDLDARLVPPGEYRDAQNVSISRSEGEDVGALENILGNISLTDFGYTTDCNIDIVGTYMDTPNDRIIVFMTNYVDTSGDRLSNFATANAICSVGSYNINTKLATVIVSGRFLNFSKTQPIYGVNMIENLLFWTDNRNQPRKINVNTALTDPSYYTLEDHISVAKIYPYQPILLYKEEITSITITSSAPDDPLKPYITENNCITTALTGTGTGLRVNVVATGGGGVGAISISNQGSGYTNGDTVTIVQRGSLATGAVLTLVIEVVSTMQDVTSITAPDGSTNNPLYNPNWPGDPDYLKERFARFSYRFKFDDDEYSLIAPFTQACFVPQQDGYFIGGDEDKSFKSTEVGFMQNKIDNIILQIPSPSGNTWDQVESDLKITELDILYKEAGQTTIKVVDTIPASVFGSVVLGVIPPINYEYEYQSSKPWKTLPSADLLRVYDQVPVRALGQEVGGNRIIYGNYIDKPTPPVALNYTVSADAKLTDTYTEVRKEYQNHTLKQNRSYQVGVILCDKYGRQSTVLLSELDDDSSSSTEKGSTMFHPFEISPFSTYNTGSLLTASDTWPGDSLKVTFIDTITSTKSSITGKPGLYDVATNPLGWYSYKIVVKQTQQDYYNIYFPGILNGYIDGESANPTAASAAEPICHFVLHADNINKVPRDLSLVGPNQTTFRTGRPSPQEDPSYYIFQEIEDGMGVSFEADPYTEEGERRLKERDRLRDLDSGSQITNASIKLSPRVENTGTATTTQSYPGVNTDLVSTIGTGNELGLWDPAANSPYNTAPVFYGYENNPYVAKVNVSDSSIGVTGPSPDAGKLVYYVSSLGAVGSDYVAGSKNVNSEVVAGSSSSGTAGEEGSGVLFNIDNVNDTGAAKGIPGTVGPLLDRSSASIANSNGDNIKGFESTSYPYTVEYTALAGNSDADIQITVNKTTWPGLMSPIFTVYETEPIESKLDIYWETSTSGLVSTLNTAIIAGGGYDGNTPVSLLDGSGNPVAYTHPETTVAGGTVTVDFEPYDDAGVTLASKSLGATIASVTDQIGGDWTSAFSIANGSGSGSFKITTDDEYYFGATSNVINKWDFAVNITVESNTYAADGSTITVQLPLTISRCALSNVTPSMTVPAGAATGSTTGGLLKTITGENGSVSIALKENELNWHIHESVISGTTTDALYFYIVDTTDGEIELWNINGTPTGVYTVKVRVTDGGGLNTVSTAITVNVT